MRPNCYPLCFCTLPETWHLDRSLRSRYLNLMAGPKRHFVDLREVCASGAVGESDEHVGPMVLRALRVIHIGHIVHPCVAEINVQILVSAFHVHVQLATR